MVQEYQDEGDVVDHFRRLFGPPGLGIQQEIVASLLQLLLLVELAELVYYVAVLKELPNSVRGDYYYSVRVGQAVF